MAQTCDPHVIEHAHQVSPNVLTSMIPSYELKPYDLSLCASPISHHSLVSNVR